MIRKPRKFLSVAAKKRIKQVVATSVYEERFLQQQYEDVNLKVVKSTCAKFDPKNPHCRICQFFSERKHIEKLGKPCPIWETVFGSKLQDTLLQIAKSNVVIPDVMRFMTIWQTRRVVQPAIPPSATIQGASTEVRHRIKTAQKFVGPTISIVRMG